MDKSRQKYREETELSVVTHEPVSQHANWPAPQAAPWSNSYPPPGYPPRQQMMGPASQNVNTNNTIIITGQPGASGPPPPRDWSSGLCACCSDPGSCLLAYFCPCCLQMSIAQDMGESCCSACCLVFCNAMTLFGLRVYMRGRQNIQGSLWDDYVKAGCCAMCYCLVLAQLAREMKYVKKTKGYF